MNEYQDEDSRTLRWILSLPGVPRPLIAALFALCWFYLYSGTYLESSARPEQVWWLNIWNGAFGGNGFSAFGAIVLAIILTSEVIFMVFSLGAYLRQKERANRAVEEARKAVEEARKAEAEEKAAAEEFEKTMAEVAKKAVAEALEGALVERAEKAARERDKEWAEWLESVRPDLDAGRPPSIEPPINGKHNGSTPE